MYRLPFLGFFFFLFVWGSAYRFLLFPFFLLFCFLSRRLCAIQMTFRMCNSVLRKNVNGGGPTLLPAGAWHACPAVTIMWLELPACWGAWMSWRTGKRTRAYWCIQQQIQQRPQQQHFRIRPGCPRCPRPRLLRLLRLTSSLILCQAMCVTVRTRIRTSLIYFPRT